MRLRHARRLAAGIVSVCALLVSSPALGATAKEVREASASGVSYLRSQQLANGSFSSFGGEWALSSFAAAGIADANVELGKGSTDARSYYRSLVGDTATWPGTSEAPVTDFETAALAAYGAGIDPARVSASQNLIAQIVARYQPAHPGYYGEPGLFNGTVFALLALAETRTRTRAQRVPEVLLEQSVAVVRKNQHTDGGWSFARAEGNKEALEEPAEVELTGAAIAALCGAGVPSSDPAIVAAKSYLVAELKAEPLGSGAFETEFGPNTDSNAWAAEGLDACGISPQSAEFTTARGKTPIDFMISQQLSGGGFKYEPAQTAANLYSSQDSVRALAGGAFTAPPPKPKGAPQWVYEKEFSTSPSVPALLSVIIAGGSSVTPCAVTISPQAKKTTLAAVLKAAESSSSPTACVTSFTPLSGAGAITSINGLPSPAAARWKVSIDGSSEKPAKRNTSIEIGDTVYLHLT